MKPTLHFGAETVDAEAFAGRWHRAAAALDACGVGERGVFALMLRNEPVVLELMLAGRWLGARWCMVNWHFKAHEVAHVLADSGAQVLVMHADLYEAVQAAIHPACACSSSSRRRHCARACDSASAPPRGRRPPGLPRWDDFRDGTARAVRCRAPGAAMLYTSGDRAAQGIEREPATPEQVLASLTMGRQALGIEAGMRIAAERAAVPRGANSYAMLAALVRRRDLARPRAACRAGTRCARSS